MNVAWVVVLLLVTICKGKRLSKSESILARSFGYGEKQIERLRSGHIETPLGCSEKKRGDDFFSRFRTYEEIEEFILNSLCKLREDIGSLGSVCNIRIIGNSIEDRPIYAIEIRNKDYPKAVKIKVPNPDQEGEMITKVKRKRKKMLLVLGTVHAREWTTTTSALLSAVRVDVTDVSVTIIPVANPDGYAYTWSGLKQIKKRWTKGSVEEVEVEARYFRKNRRQNYDGSYGVDLNRNFGSTRKIWGTDKKSKSINLTESDIYQGLSGFSEPETKAINEYYIAHRKEIVGLFDIHCCIPALLEPFTLKRGTLPQYVKTTGEAILEAINTKAPEGEKYEWKPRPVSSASGSGLSSAWAFNEAKIPFTFVLEIRGKFVMSCSDIKPVGSEVLLGLTALVEHLSKMEQLMTKPVSKTPEAEPKSSDLSDLGFVQKALIIVSIGGSVAAYYYSRIKPKEKI